MLAYYYIQHGTNDKKVLLSTPFTYTDMLSEKLLDKGIHPRDANKTTKTRKLARKQPVKVIGGESTPALETMAEMYAQKNAMKNLKKKTKSTDSGINFWFDGE